MKYKYVVKGGVNGNEEAIEKAFDNAEEAFAFAETLSWNTVKRIEAGDPFLDKPAKSLNKRAVDAVKTYLKVKGYDVLDYAYRDDYGTVVCKDNGELVFVEALYSTSNDAFDLNYGKEERIAKMEAEAAEWLANNEQVENTEIRFDLASLRIIGEDRALVKHCINYVNAQ